jgi:hypothetical protein
MRCLSLAAAGVWTFNHPVTSGKVPRSILAIAVPQTVEIAKLQYMFRSLFFLFLSIAAWAQRPSPGLKVGVPVSAVCASESSGRFGSANVCADRYVIGPSMELDIAGPLSLDFSALFTRMRLQGSARPVSIYPSFSTQRTATAWEFPVLGKYRLLHRRLAPFTSFGPTFRRVAYTGQNTIIDISGPPSPGQVVTSVSHVEETRWQAGLALGGGMEFRTHFVRFSPELRYSHWAAGKACKDCGPLTLPVARSNSTVLLLGIGF